MALTYGYETCLGPRAPKACVHPLKSILQFGRRYMTGFVGVTIGKCELVVFVFFGILYDKRIDNSLRCRRCRCCCLFRRAGLVSRACLPSRSPSVLCHEESSISCDFGIQCQFNVGEFFQCRNHLCDLEVVR